MRYTVKQLSNVAGVSPRTLHFYDQIGLLKPDAYGENGYRFYGEAQLLRLQQIMFFKELEFSLADIKETLDRPSFDMLQALRAHRQTLHERANRLSRLIETVDKTIMHVKGETRMSDSELYQGFSEEQQSEYEEEIRQRYGDRELKQSQQRWGSYSAQKKLAVQTDFDRIVKAMRAQMAGGATSPAVQALTKELHGWLGNFYDCSLETFEGVGHGYNQDARFVAFYDKHYGPGVAAFLEEAIAYYCEKQREG